MPAKVIHPLNWVRAVAALMVVAFHSQAVFGLPKYFGDPVFPVFGTGNSGVQLFFVLSGFVIYLAHHGDTQHSGNRLRNFALRRFQRVYPPLWAVLILLTPVLLIGVFGERPGLYDWIAAYAILPIQHETILTVEWTLRHEVMFYALFALFIWSRRLGLVVLIGWGALGTIPIIFMDATWAVQFIFSPYHMLFIMGMGVAWLHLNGYRAFALPVLILGLLGFTATYALALNHVLEEMQAAIPYGVAASAILYGLAGMPQWNRSVPVLDTAGAASYALYLIHFPLISALMKIVMIVDRYLHLPLWAYFLGIVAGCQIAAVLFHYWVEKPAIALFRPARKRSAGDADSLARADA